MIALFGNLSLLEIGMIAALSVMVFGRNLPRMAAQMYTHFVRARRALQSVWRESGVGEEFRQVRQEMERTAESLRQESPDSVARDVVRDIETKVREPLAYPPLTEPDEGSDEATDTGEAVEAPEEEVRPPWYPDTSADPFDRPAPEDPAVPETEKPEQDKES